MDKDRVTGAAHRAKGSIKEAIGKLTGDTEAQAEGAAEKVARKPPSAAGKAEDAMKDATEK